MAERIIAFDINAARVSGAAEGALPKHPTALQTPSPRAPARAKARAELAAAYAGLLGAQVPAADILEQMLLAVGEATAAVTGGASGEVQPEHIAAVLRVAGMTASVEEIDRLSPGQWPALAQMTSGQMVLVIAQERETLFVYDKTCADQRAEVPLADFAPYFSGRIIRARTTLKQLEERHACQRRRKNRPRGGAKPGQWRGAKRHGARAPQIAGACHGALARRANLARCDQVVASAFRARLCPSR